MKNSKAVKQKKCKECGEQFTPNRPLQQVCSPLCAMSMANKKVKKEIIKAASEEKREWKKTKKEWKQKNETYTQRVNKVKLVFQKWIRMRDAGQPCLACGNQKPSGFDGSHYFKAEVYSGLIFNEDNVHATCQKCNRFLDGNEANFRIGLIKKIGEERVKAMEDVKDSLKSYKWSDDELKEIKDKYTKLLKG